uniref:Uncharacterized protein n=1 Tax=Arundo donax TaxID=35708 RepID=A0A0A9E3V6_ARUDO
MISRRDLGRHSF